MRFCALVVAAAIVAGAAAGGGAGRERAARDDTSWLQARLDAGGGRIFLPKLPNGACYATRGLWVSHDHTQIVSNGACIQSLGPGPVRLRSPDGDPVASDAVFFVNRSRQFDPTPIHITIRGLSIVVPAATRTYGIAIYGHEVVVRDVTVSGSPVDDVYVGDRANGDGYSSRVSILNCRLSGGGRNVISAVSFIDLRIAGNRITGASNSYQPGPGGGGNPSAGIDIEPNSRGELALDLRIENNLIADNAGPGILVALSPRSGLSINADRMAIVRNRILRNGVGKGTEHGGIVFYGGQEDGRGRAVVTRNVVRGNRGPGLAGWRMTLGVEARGNDLRGNEGGPSRGVKFVRGRR
jgi:Right handed beta helix region